MNTLKFGNGEWYGKKDTILAYNDLNSNYKPLPFDFSRGSSATVVNKDGLIETVGSGEPRIDYKDDSKGALLLEPSRTNVITYSYTQSAGVWYPYSAWTVSDNSQISPKGILDASSLTENLTNGYHSGYYQPAINNGYTGSYTISCFAKYNGRNIALSPKGATERTVFNLANGTISQLGGGGVTAKIQDYGNGWYRCIVTCSFSNQNVNFEHLLANNNSLQYQGDGTSGVYIYGCQAEQGSYATSYIPTSGSVVTRLADSCSNGGNEQVINSTEGVLYFEGSLLNDDGTINTISLNDNTYSNNRLNLKLSSPSGVINGRFDSIGSDYNLSASGYDLTVNHKIALAYGLNNISLWVDGVKKDSLNTFSVFSNLIRLDFYNPFGGGSNIFNGNTKDVRVYNTALTDQELIALTTI